MKRDGGLVPREPIPGMPDDLADAIFAYGEDSIVIILRNWEAIGENGQEQYRQYVARAHLRHSRRERCRLAAMQLLRPDRPLPIPSNGGG